MDNSRQDERDAARRATEQFDVIRLSLADKQCIAQALLSITQPNPALERAFAHRNKLFVAESRHRADWSGFFASGMTASADFMADSESLPIQKRTF
jgi:hypothetical protein